MSTRFLRGAAAGLALAFAALATRVAVAGSGPGDDALLRRVPQAAGHLADGAGLVDRGTGYPAMAAVSVLLVLALVRIGRRADALRSALAVAGALAGTSALKHVVDRPRPSLVSPLVEVSPLSFPSGHATATAAVALAAVLCSARTRWLPPVAAAAVSLVLLAGAAQLVLVRHHPWDVVGGWLWAMAWTAAVWTVRADSRRRP